MSLLNIILQDSEALVCVDTEAYSPMAGLIEVSKMQVLAHANCVIAGRGALIFAIALHGNVSRANLRDIDAIERDLPKLMELAYEVVLNAQPQALESLLGPDGMQDIAAVGWSPTTGRMRGD